LDQLRGLPGAEDAEAAWTTAQAAQAAQDAAEAARAAAEGQPGWLTGRAAQGYACDAAITPIVTGRVDQAALAALAAELLAGLADDSARSGGAGHGRDGETSWDPDRGRGGHHGPRAPMHPAALARLHDTLLRHAAGILSGPGGLASFLRTRLTAGQCPSVSLPLDVGTPTHLITPCLRHAVTARDRHCAFPGCHAPPAACQIHHIKPKSKGGKTTLTNLVLLCAFHHLIAVHQWGWTLTLNADGTTTATSPDHTRTLHSHSPPSRAA
jgi:hypothetical protein